MEISYPQPSQKVSRKYTSLVKSGKQTTKKKTWDLWGERKENLRERVIRFAIYFAAKKEPHNHFTKINGSQSSPSPLENLLKR